MHPKNHITVQFPGDLMEYSWMRPKDTGLNVDIFVDDGGAYIRHGEPLLLWVRNGYEKAVGEFIPISVSSIPEILDDSITCHLKESDIQAVRHFIVINMILLREFANRRISHIEFFDAIRNSSVSSNITRIDLDDDNYYFCALSGDKTGLPLTIYIDQGRFVRSLKHTLWVYIPVCYDYIETVVPITVDDNPRLLCDPDKLKVSMDDIQTIISFIKVNRKHLENIADGIEDIVEFVNSLEKT